MKAKYNKELSDWLNARAKYHERPTKTNLQAMIRARDRYDEERDFEFCQV